MRQHQRLVRRREKVLSALQVSGQAITMPHRADPLATGALSTGGRRLPWNAPMMLSLLDAVPALFAGSPVLLAQQVTPRFVEPLMHTVRRVQRAC
jgi:hypothetical protein